MQEDTSDKTASKEKKFITRNGFPDWRNYTPPEMPDDYREEEEDIRLTFFQKKNSEKKELLSEHTKQKEESAADGQAEVSSLDEFSEKNVSLPESTKKTEEEPSESRTILPFRNPASENTTSSSEEAGKKEDISEERRVSSAKGNSDRKVSKRDGGLFSRREKGEKRSEEGRSEKMRSGGKHSEEALSGEKHSEEMRSGEKHSEKMLLGEKHSEEMRSGEKHSEKMLLGEKHSEETRSGEKNSEKTRSGEKHSEKTRSKGKHSKGKHAKENRPGKPSGKRGHSRIKWILLLLLLILLAAGAVALIRALTPSSEWVSERSYFGLSDDISYGLFINEERADSYPVKRAGYWYLDYDTIHSQISSKVYFDGENILYTDPLNTYTAIPEENGYTDEEGLSYSTAYEPCFIERGKVYVALEYLQELDYSYYLADADRCYVWVWNNWSEVTAAKVKKDGKLRYGSGIKNSIVDEVTTDETVIILEEGSKWVKVQSERGWIGCIQKSCLSEFYQVTPDYPDGRPGKTYTDRMLDETVCMAWHQVFDDSGYDELEDYLKTASDCLNVISPTWLTISDNQGNLKSLADKEYVEKCHKLGIQVWAMVDNINIDVEESQVFGITANRNRLRDAIMEVAEETGIDGINLDLEAVGSQNADHLLQFIREMSAACRKAGLVLSVDNYSPMPHTAFYDRAQQAQMVDYVIVMAYDEHYAGGETAGSTSSLAWVEQSAERTLEEVPKEKLIIGLPFYTRLWKETPAEYAANDAVLVTNDNSVYGTYQLTSTGIGMEACAQIVKEHDLSMTWLDEEKQYYVEYKEDNSLYRLWIEDETSMRWKLQAAFSYEPAGVAFFKIGLETDDIWSEITPYL